MLEKRLAVPGALLTLTIAAGLGGCGPQDGLGTEPGAEEIGTVRSAVTTLGNDFGKNTPSPFSVGVFVVRNFLTQRLGSGTNENRVVGFMRIPDAANHARWSVAITSSSTRTTTVRPVTSWINDSFSAIYRRESDMRVRDTASPPGPDVFPSYPGSGVTCPTPCMIGPPSTMPLASDEFEDNGAFEIMGNGIINQSYRPGATTWSDFPLPQPPNYTVKAGPLVINRSMVGKAGATSSSDSVWYACGAASPARACEFRRKKTNGGSRSTGYFTATFGGSTSTFADGTRPTAISNYISSGERWVFATVNDGGARTIWGLKEGGSIDSLSQQTYTAYNIDTTFMSTFSGQYSTPMPYVRSDGKVAIVYFRTSTTNTEVWQAVWDGSAWSKSMIHDAGVLIPAGNEPVPFTTTRGAPLGDQTGSVFFRLPDGAGAVRDTVELIEQGNFTYARTLMPTATDTSNIYVVQGADLLKVDEAAADTRTKLGTLSWTAAKPLATDGVGLGYTVLGDALYEVNLNDGTRRQIGTGWTGTTHLAFGWDSANRKIPRLWAIRSGTLYKLDLSNGSTTLLWGTNYTSWPNAQAMAYLPTSGSGGADLYIVGGDNSLYKVNANTGTPALVGTAGAFTNTKGLTVTSDGKFYICYGPNASILSVKKLNPSTGAILASMQTSFASFQGFASVKTTAYIMQSFGIFKVNDSGGGLSITLSGTQNWPSTVTAMAGRDM
jgi:hypothetical protein